MPELLENNSQGASDEISVMGISDVDNRVGEGGEGEDDGAAYMSQGY